MRKHRRPFTLWPGDQLPVDHQELLLSVGIFQTVSDHLADR